MAILDADQLAFLARARRGVLGTIAVDGRPRLVPVCFVVTRNDPPVVLIPLDEKPKSVPDPRRLARVRDIERDPRATLLVDRWSEDWSELAWLRCDGRAALVEPSPENGRAVGALREKYPQYRIHDLEARPLLRVEITTVRGWAADP